MRLAVVLASCAACGRVGFDTLAATAGSGSADAGHDATLDAPAVRTTYLLSAGPTSTDPTDLLTLDLRTGHLTLVGQLDATLGQLGGLAYWDANTLYATGSGNVVQITISPFSFQQVATGGLTISALERSGSELIGMATTDQIVRFTPPYTNVSTVQFSDNVSGGDIVQLSNAAWYYFTNSLDRFETFDLAGAASVVAMPNPGGVVSALLRDDQDHMYITVETTNQLIPIDTTTGALGAPLTLCESCPTPYTLGAGDATRTP